MKIDNYVRVIFILHTVNSMKVWFLSKQARSLLVRTCWACTVVSMLYGSIQEQIRGGKNSVSA